MIVRQAHYKKQNGQALIMVILLGVVGLIAVVSVVALVVSELKKSVSTGQGIVEYQVAYGTMENAFMRLLRDPEYSGETVVLGSSTCYVTATSGSAKTVISRCTNGVYVRKISATVTFSNGLMTVSNISEVP